MAPVQCGHCQRTFSSSQYFHLHLNHRSNRLCYLHSVNQAPNGNFFPVNSSNEPSSAADEPPLWRLAESLEVQETVDDGPNQATDDFPIQDSDETAEVGPEFPPELPPHMPNEGEEVDKADQTDQGQLIRLLFAEYTAHSQRNREWVDPEVEAGIELMHILTVSRAPLVMFDKLFDWHLAHLACKTSITRSSLLNKLRDRYNMKGTEPYEVKITLPSSNVRVKVPCHDASHQIMDLLTDPRIEATDYLWCNGDPEGVPPEEWLELGDLVDGKAYRATYEKKIRPAPYTESGRRKVLLPILLYMDSCVTGLNENLGLELVKFTLGIFNSKAREKDYTWRVLGAIPQFQSVKADAAAAIESSGHIEAEAYVTESDSDRDTPNVRRFRHEFEVEDYINSSDEEEDMCDIALPDTPAQDLHVLLQVIMHGIKRIIRQGGFEWDINHNQELRQLHFVPFMLLIKGDTVEHDKHTGHYGARTRGVKCLCRYCTCPSDKTDDPFADYPLKTTELVRSLVATSGF